MADLDTASKRISSVGLWGAILALPLPDATLDQGDRQHVAVSYSGILAAAGAALTYILDMNTRIKSYLIGLYLVSDTTADATTLTRRHLNGTGGDATKAMQTLITDATP